MLEVEIIIRNNNDMSDLHLFYYRNGVVAKQLVQAVTSCCCKQVTEFQIVPFISHNLPQGRAAHVRH